MFGCAGEVDCAVGVFEDGDWVAVGEEVEGGVSGEFDDSEADQGVWGWVDVIMVRGA